MEIAPTIVRWTPTLDTPELPLSLFNLTWSAEGRLVFEGFYPKELDAPVEGIVVSFDDPNALMSFEEYSDYLDDLSVDWPALAKSVRYGGCWPFVEILASPWLAEVTGRDAALDAADFRHWAILTRNRSLHIMLHKLNAPIFEGWLEKSWLDER